MRKLDLTDYQFTRKVQNPVTGGVTEVALPVLVKDSILNVLFNPALKLMGAALIRQNVLAMKIEQSGDDVLLEEEEYGRVVEAINNYPAQQRSDVQLVDRILNQTPQVEIK